MTEVPRRTVIVAGVDGSPEAAAALEVAIEEARLRRAVLHVTYAYPAMASQLTGSTAKEYYGRDGARRQAGSRTGRGRGAFDRRSRGRMAGHPGEPVRGADRGKPGGQSVGGRLAGIGGVQGPFDGLGLESVRAPRPLPGARRPHGALSRRTCMSRQAGEESGAKPPE